MTDMRETPAPDTPILSVIVPAYNAESTVEQCVRSIQSNKNIPMEIILVNDGSTDLTGQICNAIAFNDPRVKVIHKANGGAGTARNAGIEISRGVFIAFVDADDTVADNIYEQMISLAKNHDADCVMCNIENVFAAHTRSECHVFGNQTIHGNLNIHERIVVPLITPGHRDAALLASGCNKLYRTDLIQKHHIQFTQLPRAEDWMFNIEYFQKANCVTFTQQRLYRYDRTTPGSLSKTWHQNSFDNALWIQNRLVKLFPERYPEEGRFQSVLQIQADELRLYANCCGTKRFADYSAQLFQHEQLRYAYRHVQMLPKRFRFPKKCMQHEWKSGYFLWCIYTAKTAFVKHALRPAYHKVRWLLRKRS